MAGSTRLYKRAENAKSEPRAGSAVELPVLLTEGKFQNGTVRLGHRGHHSAESPASDFPLRRTMQHTRQFLAAAVGDKMRGFNHAGWACLAGLLHHN